MTFGLTSAEASPDWSHTANDYARWRPDYPTSFYQRLAAFGVGRAHQKVLDIGTGTGFVATSLAARGARVWATDIAPGQVAMAQQRAQALGLEVTCRVAPAEDSGLAGGFFDAVTASQCWGYFDHTKVITDIGRLLRPAGVLAIMHLSWLPPASEIVRATEALILQHTPSWSSGGWDGSIPRVLKGTEPLEPTGHFVYDENLPFTHESWRGRIRASRPIGATLNAEGVARFDAAHTDLLARIAPDRFGIPHRISAHFYRVPGGGERSHASKAA